MRPLLIFVLLGLAACQRPGDTQPPLIGITQPKSGVLSQRSLRIEGYALDDTGIKSVKLNGQELLNAQRKGQKLVRFASRVESPQSGRIELKIEATDTTGQTRTMRLPLTLDARPPQIRIDRVERVINVVQPARTRTREDGSTEETPAVTEAIMQISGRVLDDTGVDRITIQAGGSFRPLSVTKGTEVSFYDEITERRATIIAVDAAGNRTTLTVSR